MVMSNTSLHFFVLFFVLACACAYIASEERALAKSHKLYPIQKGLTKILVYWN